jgi:hypothetical protein
MTIVKFATGKTYRNNRSGDRNLEVARVSITLVVRVCLKCNHVQARHKGCTSWLAVEACEECHTEGLHVARECSSEDWTTNHRQISAEAIAALAGPGLNDPGS